MFFKKKNKDEIDMIEKIIEIDGKYQTSLIEALSKAYSKINKANYLLQKILIVSDCEHKGNFRPVKNTKKQDVYKTICMLNELLETPHRINYELLGEKNDR